MENSIDYDISPITYDDAVRFLEAVSPNAKCPMCANSSWLIAMQPENSDLVQRLIYNIYEDDKHYNAFVLASCATCGFNRTHNPRMMIDWLRHNPAAPEATAHD